MIFFVVAMYFGDRICGLPFCHCARKNASRGAPSESHESGPRIVFTRFECSQSAILSWSSLPTFLTAACSTCAAANASAASSVGIGVLYAFLYALTNCLFIGKRFPFAFAA